MPSINYAYAIGEHVFHIDEHKGVREGVVKALTVDVRYGDTTIQYDVAFVKSQEGSVTTVEDTLSDDVDAALALYKSRYLG